MKYWFFRGVAYAGLYAEIFSALCRWLSKGSRLPWRTFVTRELISTKYLPPTKEEREAELQQRKINEDYPRLLFHLNRPESIRTCLQTDKNALEETVKSSIRIENRWWVSKDVIKLSPYFWQEYNQ